MKSISTVYSEELKNSLEKHDIPFAFDEETITVFFTQNSFFCSDYKTAQLLPAIIPILKRPVFVQDHFHTNNWINSPDTHFYITCFPQDSYKRSDKYRIFQYKGKKVNNTDGADYINIQDVPDFAIPIKDDTEKVIGFIAYNIINIFFDIMHSDLKPLYVELIKDAVNSYLMIEDNLKALFNEFLSVKGRVELIKYIKLMSDKEKNKMEREVEGHKQNIKDYSAYLINSYENLRNATLKLKGLETGKINAEEEVEKLISEYNLKFNTEGLIWFETEDIRIKDILLGKFKITLNINSGTIRILNLTRRIDQYDHPHINNGVLCLGELANAISKLITEYKYIEVARLCKEVLYFYNQSSAHVPLERWIDTKEVVACT